MNRNKKPSNKENNIYLNKCLLPTVLPEVGLFLPKLCCLATPGKLHGSAVSFVSSVLFAITEVLLPGNKNFVGSLKEIG
jgi:hypothetical protein